MDCGTSIVHMTTSSPMAVQGQELWEFPLTWDFPPCLLKLAQVWKINTCSHEYFLFTLSAFTSPRENMAMIDPLVQECISNSKYACGKHSLYTHQLLMMNFISWVMPELCIHLHFRYLFCFNIGQPRTCSAPQRKFIKVIDSIMLRLPPPKQEQKAIASFTQRRCDATWKGTGRTVR